MICLHFFYQISLLQSNKKIKMEKSYVRDQNFIKKKKKVQIFPWEQTQSKKNYMNLF